MTRTILVICPGCGRKLFHTAICIYCENAKKEAYQRLFEDICKILEDSGFRKRKKFQRKPKPTKK